MYSEYIQLFSPSEESRIPTRFFSIISDSAGQNMFRYQTFYSYQFQMNISQNTQMIFICSFSFRYSTPEPVAKTAIFFFEICHPIQIYMLFRCNSWHSGAVPDEES